MKKLDKRLGLIALLVGCLMVAIGVMQCGGDTTSTTGPITAGDGGAPTGNTGPSGGW
jgi:hypothetical protein